MIGCQSPRICQVPAYSTSAGEEAIQLAAVAGLHLDEWQRFVLVNALGERADGRWAAPTVGLVVGRQNGKNAVLEARELAGVFLLGEETIIHSAHEQATSSEHFRRLLSRIEGVPEFERRVLKVSRGKGAEAIELRGGQRILFKTRTGGGGRGFSVDLIVYDEAMILSAAAKAALVPTMAARSMEGNTQTWYSGSAVDQLNPKHDGLELARIRDLGIKGADGIAYFEWSAPGDDPEALADEQRASREMVAQANPGLGIRISEEWVVHERTIELGPREFAVERLGVGDWPNVDGEAGVIDMTIWNALHDRSSSVLDPVCFAYDVSPDRSWATIAVCGDRPDGLRHLEYVARERGATWVPERVAELVEKHDAIGVVYDGIGAAGALAWDIEQLGVKILRPVTTTEHGFACGGLLSAVHEDGDVRHLGQPEFTAAVRSGVKRPLGDGQWAWSRKNSSSDITPLVAASLAHWGWTTNLGKQRRGNVGVIDLASL